MPGRLHTVLSAGIQQRAVAERHAKVRDVGVASEDHANVVWWARNSGRGGMKNLKWEDGPELYQLQALVQRCEELFGDRGRERVSAAILHYMDANDKRTATAVRHKERLPPRMSRSPVAERVWQALRDRKEWLSKAEEAQHYLARAKRQLESDNAETAGISRGTLRENNNGPSYEELFPNSIQEYYRSVLRLADPTTFPPSLWPDAPPPASRRVWAWG